MSGVRRAHEMSEYPRALAFVCDYSGPGQSRTLRQSGADLELVCSMIRLYDLRHTSDAVERGSTLEVVLRHTKLSSLTKAWMSTSREQTNVGHATKLERLVSFSICTPLAGQTPEIGRGKLQEPTLKP